MNLNEYYKYYLSLHKNHMCRRMHFLGQIATLLFVYYIFTSYNWLLLFLVPLIVYPFAWTGHLLYEKNKPLAWKGKNDYGWTTLKSKISDWIMFKDIIIGRLSI